jgi:hypothetical protein
MASVRTKIQTETQRKGPPKNLGKGELAYNEVDGLLYIGTGAENRGQARKKLAIGGEEFSDTDTLNEDSLKEALFKLGYATEDYVDDKYSREDYVLPTSEDESEDVAQSGDNDEWVFNFTTNQHEWAVTHNLGYYPSVTTMALISDDNYEEFDAYVQHNSVNDLTVICTGTTTGKLLLR